MPSTPSKRATLLAMALIIGIGLAQAQLPAYTLFNAKGKAIKYNKAVKQAKGADIILFGELHNNAIAHWLQLELTRELGATGPLVLGAEMIERDDQATLDRYLGGEIDAAAFDTLARLWNNYASDYKPLVDFAKEHHFPFVAANVPRRYARAVARGGFEALDTVPQAELSWIAPLPIAFDPQLPRYQHMLTMMGDHGTVDVVKAQALKDATMAQSIADHFRPGARFIHYNGSYHSDFHEGVNWYLQRLRPELKRLTIATVTQAGLKRLDPEHIGRADISIAVDEDIPGTY